MGKASSVVIVIIGLRQSVGNSISYTNLTNSPRAHELERQEALTPIPSASATPAFRGSHKNLPATLKFFGERGAGVIFFVALFRGFLATAKYDGPALDS